MNNTLKIALLVVSALFFTVFLVTFVNGTTGNCFNSVYECDKDNDGIVDAVYYYTFDIEENVIKAEIDSDNDGLIDESCCYCLGTEMKNKQGKKITGT
jgi:hypothetical protein